MEGDSSMKKHTLSVKDEMTKMEKVLDFVAEKLDQAKNKKESNAYYNVYRMLSYAWEFISLQCRHLDGFKKSKNGAIVCKICGTVKGREERFILLPRKGRKTIGRAIVPSSKKIFENKKKAQVVYDEIAFHGARIDVDVHNSYEGEIIAGQPIRIAAERIVTLREGKSKCTIDDYMVTLSFNEDRPVKAKPNHEAFIWELRKKDLNKFPIMINYGDDFTLKGLSIFKERKTNKQL
jgi:hypothetical protein